METIDKLAWVYIKDRKVLMTRSKGKDIWYFPGGKREAGETDQQALLREIKEEVGVDLLPNTLQFIGEFETSAHGKPKGTMLHTKYYTADFEGIPVASGEVEELGFVDTTCDPNLLTEMGHLVFGWLKQKDQIF
jgi:8-oxo-dGTP diphosphatase